MTAKPIEVTDAEFEETVLKADVPVLVDFWAPWCGPCHMVAPALEELAGEYVDRAVIAKVNTDLHQQRAMRYGVRGIPTMILFVNGQEADRMVGALPKAAIRERLDRLVAAVH